MNFLQGIFNGCILSLENTIKPFYLLIFGFIIAIIGVIILPYRVSMLVGDAQTELNIIADILALPLSEPVVCVIALVALFLFTRRR